MRDTILLSEIRTLECPVCGAFPILDIHCKPTIAVNIFCFRYVHVLNEFTPDVQVYTIPDISYGKENVIVRCVNSLDNTFPEYVEYSTVR